jgi:hypothetical protein
MIPKATTIIAVVVGVVVAPTVTRGDGTHRYPPGAMDAIFVAAAVALLLPKKAPLADGKADGAGVLIVTRAEDGEWGGIQSQEEMSAFFPRTGQMFSCSAAVLRKFCRTHFLFAGQYLFSGQILAFDSLPPVKKLFCGNSAEQIFCRTAEQTDFGVR